MNYLDDYRCIPWLLSKPVSRHPKRVEEEVEEEELSYPLWKPATVWGSFSRERKYIIIKMEKKFVDSAAEFLEKNFFKNDILCKGVNLMYERASVDYYKDLMKYWLRDRTSLLAIEEGNERLVGVLIARIIYLVSGLNLDIDYSRIGICNDRVQEIQDLRVNMRKEILKVASLERAEEKCFEIKLVCVDRVELIADDIEKRLVKGLYVLASEANVPLLIGVMSSLHQQQLFRSEGFKRAFSANYEDLKKRDYILFPSKEPETSIVGFFKFLDGVYRSAYVEESMLPKRRPSDELPVESYSEDSLTDPDEEPYRMLNLYLTETESDSEDDWYSTEQDESYKNISKLMIAYNEQMETEDEEAEGEEEGAEAEEEEAEGEEEEEEEELFGFSEYSGFSEMTDLSEEEFLSE